MGFYGPSQLPFLPIPLGLLTLIFALDVLLPYVKIKKGTPHTHTHTLHLLKTLQWLLTACGRKLQTPPVGQSSPGPWPLRRLAPRASSGAFLTTWPLLSLLQRRLLACRLQLKHRFLTEASLLVQIRYPFSLSHTRPHYFLSQLAFPLSMTRLCDPLFLAHFSTRSVSFTLIPQSPAQVLTSIGFLNS